MPGMFSPPPRVSDPDMHHGTCVMHVPWCMAGSLVVSFEVGRGENVPGIPSAYTTRNFTYLARGPLGGPEPLKPPTNLCLVSALDPGRYGRNFKRIIFILTIQNIGLRTHWRVALRWMPQDLTDDKSTYVQVMGWCRQATSHYPSQSWPRSMLPYGIISAQRVN